MRFHLIHNEISQLSSQYYVPFKIKNLFWILWPQIKFKEPYSLLLLSTYVVSRLFMSFIAPGWAIETYCGATFGWRLPLRSLDASSQMQDSYCPFFLKIAHFPTNSLTLNTWYFQEYVFLLESAKIESSLLFSKFEPERKENLRFTNIPYVRH